MSGGCAVVVHGGAGASPGDVDGCHAAANAALRVLQANGESLDAVVQAVITLENDGRFNAGSGSALAPDGVTIEMDASVMDTRGRLGAIACVRDVRNPVLLARDVAGTPHRLLAGEGAQRFADVRGLARMGMLSEAVRQRRMQRLKEEMAEMTPEQNAKREAVMRLWNYPGRPLRRADDVCNLDAAFGGGARAQNAACDTVGAVARDADGHFAVACSTGGVAPALLGRVGDTPLIGAGFYVGKEGAVAVTGTGEDIIPLLLAHTVYQWIADGAVLQQALERGVAQLPPGSDIGIIAVSRTESGHASNRDMPTSTGA